jgi:hypothetical protein
LLPSQTLQAADEIQELVSAIINSDRDCDYILKEKELDEVMMRMRAFDGKNGSNFDEDALRAAFKGSLTRKGSSLIRIHSALSANDYHQASKVPSTNEYQQPSQLIIHRPVQSLQKIPREDPTDKVIDTAPREIPTVASGLSAPTVQSTGLVTTTVPMKDGTESYPISLLNDIVKNGTEPSGHLASPSDDSVLRRMLAPEEFDGVKGDKEETPWIGFILQSFSGGTGVARHEQMTEAV